MNKEQIIDEVYERYSKEYEKDSSIGFRLRHKDKNGNPTYGKGNKESFINKCKTDDEFSQKWGVKIEERELSLGERNQIGNFDYTMCDDSLIYPTMEDDRKKYKELFDKENIPTKAITLIYQNKTVITYE